MTGLVRGDDETGIGLDFDRLPSLLFSLLFLSRVFLFEAGMCGGGGEQSERKKWRGCVLVGEIGRDEVDTAMVVKGERERGCEERARGTGR